MIAPKNYVPFSELYQSVKRSVWTELLQYYNHEAEEGKEFLNLFRPGDVLLSWLIASLEPKYYLFKDNELLFRIDPYAINAKARNIPKVGLDKTQQIDGVIHSNPDMDMSFKFRLAPRLKLENLEINQNTKNMFMSDDCFLEPFLFIEPNFFVVDFSLYDFLARNEEHLFGFSNLSNVSHAATILRKYEGASLCVSANQLDDDWFDYWQDIAKKSIEVSSQFPRDIYPLEIAHPVSKRNPPEKRPSKPEIAASVLTSLPSVELANLTYKEKARVIFETTGIKISKDSILRSEGKK